MADERERGTEKLTAINLLEQIVATIGATQEQVESLDAFWSTPTCC